MAVQTINRRTLGMNHESRLENAREIAQALYPDTVRRIDATGQSLFLDVCEEEVSVRHLNELLPDEYRVDHISMDAREKGVMKIQIRETPKYLLE